jgi:hypothetical protein
MVPTAWLSRACEDCSSRELVLQGAQACWPLGKSSCCCHQMVVSIPATLTCSLGDLVPRNGSLLASFCPSLSCRGA